MCVCAGGWGLPPRGFPGPLAGAQGLCPVGHHGRHRSFPGPKLDWVALSPHVSTVARAGITSGGPGWWAQEGCLVTGHVLPTGRSLPLGTEAATWRPEPPAVAHRGMPARLTWAAAWLCRRPEVGQGAAAGRGGPAPPPQWLQRGPVARLWAGCWAASSGAGKGVHGCTAAAPLGAGAGLLSLKQNCI